jgi:hypothetical protein
MYHHSLDIKENHKVLFLKVLVKLAKLDIGLESELLELLELEYQEVQQLHTKIV